MMMDTRTLGLGIALGILLAGIVWSEETTLITPVSATASSVWTGTPGYVAPQYLIDCSGLTGSGRLATHTNANAAGLFWHSNTGITVSNQWVEFDLGKLYTLSNALIWQLAQAGLTTRGVKKFTIKGAKSDRVFTTLSTDNVLNQAIGTINEPAQIIPLTASSIRYVRFEIQSNWGADNIVGLSEVRFEGGLRTPNDLIWNGTAGNATWTTVSMNWLTNSVGAIFQHGDNVRFDDTASEKQIVITNDLTVGAIVVDTSEIYRIVSGVNANQRITAATAFVKHGPGILELGGGTSTVANTYHTFTNDMLIAHGTVSTRNEGRTGILNPSEGLLGNPSVSRNIIVSNGATLHFGGKNTLGTALSTPKIRLILTDGGVLTNSHNQSNTLGPALFDNGILAPLSGSVASGLTNRWASLIFNDDVTFQGRSPYVLSGVNNAALSLGYATIPSVHVANITGDVSADVTWNIPLINFGDGRPTRFKKVGLGTLCLGSTGSTFTGDVTVAEGLLEVVAGLGVANLNASVLGHPKVPHCIRVLAGATLKFTGSNTLAPGFESPLTELEMRGGTLALATNSSNVFGPLTLNDASIVYSTGYNTEWGMMIFTTGVTFKGTHPMIFNPVSSNNTLACGLNEETDLCVWDITESDATDVSLNLPFINFGSVTNKPPSRFKKTGAGTLSLGANNTSTGALRVTEGVLRIDGSWAAVNASVAVERDGWLGGTGRVARARFTGGGLTCTAGRSDTLTVNAVTIEAAGSIRVLNPLGIPAAQLCVPAITYTTLEGAEHLENWTVDVEGIAPTINLRVKAKNGKLTAEWAPKGFLIQIL